MELVTDSVRLFLACVLLASAWGKRGTLWRARLVGYELLPQGVAMAVAPFVPWGELAVAVALVRAGGIGLVAAGVTFLAFGTVLALARHAGYQGECGCSRTGRVSWLATFRAFTWGTLALAIGMFTSASAPYAAAFAFLALGLATVGTVGASLLLLRAVDRARGGVPTRRAARSGHSS